MSYTGQSHIRVGHEVTYTGPSWLAHAVEHTHGRGVVIDGAGGHATVRYAAGLLIVPVTELAFFRDRLEVAWQAQEAGEARHG